MPATMLLRIAPGWEWLGLPLRSRLRSCGDGRMCWVGGTSVVLLGIVVLAPASAQGAATLDVLAFLLPGFFGLSGVAWR